MTTPDLSDVVRWMVEVVTSTEHSAISAGTWDLDLLKWDVHFDGDAVAAVRFSVGGVSSDSVLPLADVGRLLQSGAQVIEIGPPLKGSVMWSALALADGYTIASLDPRGVGLLSASRSPSGTGRSTLGARIQSLAERSGVNEVNERRKQAIRLLYSEYGNDPPDFRAQRIAMTTRVETIVRYFADTQPATWCIFEGGRLSASGSSLVLPSGRIADRIVDAISTEAYGATRPHLPRAQSWVARFETDSEPNGDLGEGHEDHQAKRGVVHEHISTPIGGWPSGEGRLISEWTLSQGGSDPTGSSATALVDHIMSVPGALGAGLDGIEVVRSWQGAGLTDRQIQVMVVHQLGFSDAEIGARLKIAKSTVRATLATSRRKLREISKTA